MDDSGRVVGFAYNTLAQGTAISPDAIAVVFAPGQPSAYALTSISLSPANAVPGAPITATVTLAGPAPAGGVTLNFLSTNSTVIDTPAQVLIPAGQSSASLFLSASGFTLTVPTAAKLFVTDGTASRVAPVTVTPVVNLSSLTVNPVEGGFTTSGTITLSIPAQSGGATIALASTNTSLATVPASITIPQGATTASFTATTNSVTTATTVPISATFNGKTLTASLTLSPAPVVAVSSLTFNFPSIIGGKTMDATVTVSNFPRGAAGAVITLTSANPDILQVPASVTIPQGAYSATFTATTTAVTGTKGVSVKASYNASNITTTLQVVPTPTVTITQADYLIDLKMFKVAATTTYANSVLTYGGDPNSPAIGTMQFEQGVFKGATILDTAPVFATVWNSNGGQATIAVTQKYSSTGGGGGGGSTTASSYKLTATRSGKGTIVSNPSGIACGLGSGGCSASFAAGATVTLTATPDPGSAWTGWTGACTGTATTCTITLSSDKSATANFR